MAINVSVQYNGGLLPDMILLTQCYYGPVAQRYLVTLDTLGREFDPGKRDFSH